MRAESIQQISFSSLTASHDNRTPFNLFFCSRARLEDEITGLETVIYDNILGLPDDEYGGTELGGGNIVVHTKK